MRQLDVPLKDKRPANVPIEGSTRARAQQNVQRQAERILPGIGSLEPKPPKVRKPHGPLRQAWGEAASAMGMALALGLRVPWVRWGLRVLCLTLLIILAQPVLWGLTLPLYGAWRLTRLVKWFEARDKRHPNGGLPTCQCKH